MVVVHRKVMFPTVILGVKFFPGMNSISDGELKKLREHPKKTFSGEIECGNMMLSSSYESNTSEAVEKPSLKDRGFEIAKEIGEMKVADAKEVIDGINDFNILKALKKQDGRTGIQNAVDKRISDIQNQVGADLTPESKPAPEGTGEDFMESGIKGTKADIEGRSSHTAVPALKKGYRKKGKEVETF